MLSNWMVKVARFFAVLLLALFAINGNAQKIVERTLDLQASNIQLAQALDLIATSAEFKLSYNSDIVPEGKQVDLFANGSTVKELLDQLLGPGMAYKQSGEHLIILGPKAAKKKVKWSGRILDSGGSPIEGVTILEVDEVNATRSGPSGQFQLTLSGKRTPTGLLFLHFAYKDTVLFVDPEQDGRVIHLRPLYSSEKLDIRRTDTLKKVEDQAITRLLVSKEKLELTQNMNFLEERAVQFSVIPGVSTNKSISGSVTNKYSFNLFAGYQGGLNGIEIGGLANVVRSNVNGFQASGLANLAGGHTRGVQLAGFANSTLRSLNGAQLSGFVNVVWDTLTGVQLTGGVNMLRGGMKGAQISGLGNITTKDCNGTQVSGGFNVTVGKVTTSQFSGLINYGRHITGSQFTFGVNVTPGDVSGGQLGILSNYARNVEGAQVGLVNVCGQQSVGGQVGLINYSTRAKGTQIGFLNVSDTIEGVSIGILSVALHGYHRAEVYINEMLPVNVSLRTGHHRFYNTFSYGRSIDSLKWSLDSSKYWSAGYGFGTEINWPKKHTVNVELTANHINERLQFIEALNLVGRLEVLYNYTFIERITISAGPSFNMLFSNWQDAETDAFLSEIAPYKMFENTSNDLLTQGWIGWHAGVGVRF